MSSDSNILTSADLDIMADINNNNIDISLEHGLAAGGQTCGRMLVVGDDGLDLERSNGHSDLCEATLCDTLSPKRKHGTETGELSVIDQGSPPKILKENKDLNIKEILLQEIEDIGEFCKQNTQESPKVEGESKEPGAMNGQVEKNKDEVKEVKDEEQEVSKDEEGNQQEEFEMKIDSESNVIDIEESDKQGGAEIELQEQALENDASDNLIQQTPVDELVGSKEPVHHIVVKDEMNKDPRKPDIINIFVYEDDSQQSTICSGTVDDEVDVVSVDGSENVRQLEICENSEVGCQTAHSNAESNVPTYSTCTPLPEADQENDTDQVQKAESVNMSGVKVVTLPCNDGGWSGGVTVTEPEHLVPELPVHTPAAVDVNSASDRPSLLSNLLTQQNVDSSWYDTLLTSPILAGASAASAMNMPPPAAASIQSNFAQTMNQFAPSLMSSGNLSDFSSSPYMPPVIAAPATTQHQHVTTLPDGQGKIVYTPHPKSGGYVFYVSHATESTPPPSPPKSKRTKSAAASKVKSTPLRTTNLNTPKRQLGPSSSTPVNVTLNSSGEENQSPPDHRDEENTPSDSKSDNGQVKGCRVQRGSTCSSPVLRPEEEQCRQQHNQKERKRRARIKEACDLMRQLVPGMSDKTDKATVFEFAARYIHFLKCQVGSEKDKDFLLKYSPY